MARKALLIGLNIYTTLGSNATVSPAVQNLAALTRVLQSDIGQFRDGQIETLINPDAQQMRQALEHLSGGARPDDLRLLYFCGLGLIDTLTGCPYLAGWDTQPSQLMTTALSYEFIQAVLNNSNSRQQVIILDNAWFQAEAEGLQAAYIDANYCGMAQFANPYRAVLLAQNTGDIGWSVLSPKLSDYTHHLIEGIESGLADLGADGVISVSDLHQYIEQGLNASDTPAQARLYAPGKSADIALFNLPQYQAEAEYRRSVEEYVTQGQGHINEHSRQVLDFLRTNLGLSTEVSQAIEAAVLRPYQEREERLLRYEQAFTEAIQLENPPRQSLRRWLRHLQQTLTLSYDDIAQVEARVLAAQPSPAVFNRPAQPLEPIPQIVEYQPARPPG